MYRLAMKLVSTVKAKRKESVEERAGRFFLV